MYRRIALLTGGALAVTLTLPVAAAAPRDDGTAEERRAPVSKAQAGTNVEKPEGVNPYLGLVADPSTVDYPAWRRYMESRSKAKDDRRDSDQSAQRRAPRIPPLVVDEAEPDGENGANDSVSTGQKIQGLGTQSGKNPRSRILGSLAPPDPVALTPLSPNTEDDGAIPLARDTLIDAIGEGVATSGTIGDGPHGSTGTDNGDFDYYEVQGVEGSLIVADIDTPTGDLDSLVSIYDSEGNEVEFNDDEDGRDSLASYLVPEDGAYYVAVAGYPTFQTDPFDSSSGLGSGSEGPYELAISQTQPDLDFYGVKLQKGDVLGASVEGGGTQMSIYENTGVNVHGSNQDATYIYPMDTPLPGGGNAVTEHVADHDGWHYLAVESGEGDYRITAEVYRPGLEGGKQKQKQTIFLDFNGARINTGIWGGPGVRTLSPLKAFMGRWGLSADRYDILVDTIVSEVKENLKADLKASGLNDDFRLRVMSSDDYWDQWGKPDVSRVIVGGTINQSGVDTIGIAQSIDPGNFDTEESALVLLDVLSSPAGEEGDPSLNTYIKGGQSHRVAFIGQAIGNVTSHEAGHFFGNWHVDQFDDQANLMDQGGNFPVLYGVGPDMIGGTADDVDVDFGEDTFNPDEGFFGIEDTLSRLAVVLTR